MQLARRTQLGVTGLQGAANTKASLHGPVAGAGDAAGVVEPRHYRHRETTADVEALEELDAHVEIVRAFLHRLEVGEISQIAQLQFVESRAGTDESLRVPHVGVAPLVVLADIVDLREIVLAQPRHQLEHAWSSLRGAPLGASRFTLRHDTIPRGIRAAHAGLLVDIEGVHIMRQGHLPAAVRHMSPDRIGVSVDADQQQIDGGVAAEAGLEGSPEFFQARPAGTGRAAVIATVGRATLVTRFGAAIVIHDHLQVARPGPGRNWLTLVKAAV